MKEYVTLKKIENSLNFQKLERMDYRFGSITELFDPFMSPGRLIQWFYDEKETSEGNEFVSIDKERGVIALYDISEYLGVATVVCTNDKMDPARRFDMSIKNFAEILYQWEELRVSRPDIILVVIHEDNHVSLETDSKIIKEYQDSGYAFDINKAPKCLEDYIYLERPRSTKILSSFLVRPYSSLESLLSYFEETYFPNQVILFHSMHTHHNKKDDTMYIGYYPYAEYIERTSIPEIDQFVECIIDRTNFLEFTENWLALENSSVPYALIYKNEHDWVDCKGFNTEEELYDFVINYRT